MKVPNPMVTLFLSTENNVETVVLMSLFVSEGRSDNRFRKTGETGRFGRLFQELIVKIGLPREK